MICAEILDSGSPNLLPNYDNWNGYGKIIDCFNQKSLKNYISKETLVNSEILTISSSSNDTYSSLNNGWRVSSLVQDSQAACVTSQYKKLKYIFPVEFSFLYHLHKYLYSCRQLFGVIGGNFFWHGNFIMWLDNVLE